MSVHIVPCKTQSGNILFLVLQPSLISRRQLQAYLSPSLSFQSLCVLRTRVTGPVNSIQNAFVCLLFVNLETLFSV